jgi:hypothetical protein
MSPAMGSLPKPSALENQPGASAVVERRSKLENWTVR